MYPLIAYPAWLNQETPSTDREQYITYSGIQIPIDIQPESPTVTALSEGEVFATFHFFSPYSGLRPNWLLTISGSNPVEIYRVRGVDRYKFGAGVHYEGTLIRETQ